MRPLPGFRIVNGDLAQGTVLCAISAGRMMEPFLQKSGWAPADLAVTIPVLVSIIGVVNARRTVQIAPCQ